MNYAGFWRRLGALIVDLVVVLVVLVPASHGLEALGVAMFESVDVAADTTEQSVSFEFRPTETGSVIWLVATWPYFAKLLLLGALFIGFAMAGFTGRKQALHDILARCLVLAKAA